MSIADELRYLLEEHDECALVAFADLSSKMVLLSSSLKRMPQEYLDRLCAEATTLFNGPAAQMNTKGTPITAMVTDTKKSHIYLRSDISSPDVLCCICGPEIDLSAFLISARARLDNISGGHA